MGAGISHDPGPTGDSGEGETVIVCICLTYAFTAGWLMRQRLKPLLGIEDSNSSLPATAQKIVGQPEKEPPHHDVEMVAVTGVKDSSREADTAEAAAGFDAQDSLALEAWTQPEPYDPSPEFREKFIKYTSLGLVQGDVFKPEEGTAAFKAFYYLSGVNWLKVSLFFFVWYLIWLFLVCLGLMGTGFKLLGGKDSAKMFDVVDNPISGLMVGILATVLVQSSSTSTSIIIGLVGADELSVSIAIPMVMGANIGTSVTNTLVAMGHFSNPDELRRGFGGATVHDCFNILSVAILLPFQWMSNFLGEMSYAMAKDADPCNEDEEDCEKTEFIKPYLKPYISGVVSYDKKVAQYVAEEYCDGQCGDSPSSYEKKNVTSFVCGKKDDEANCDNIDGYKKSWVDDNVLKKKRLPGYIKFVAGNEAAAEYYYDCPVEGGCDSDSPVGEFWNSTSDTIMQAVLDAAANPSGQIFEVCHKMKYDLCDARLLKGGLMLDDWELDDEGAGTLAVLFSISGLCCVLYLIVQSLQILIKGLAARYLRKAVTLNGYLSMMIGCFVTIMVQSSSITTSVLTPLVAVGLISLEDMFPLTLGANIGTTITGIMAATVVTSNPVEAWQVAICHLFFNLFGIIIWYPIPFMRNIPIKMARQLGVITGKYPWFPLAYVATAFFIVPGICYGIAVAATS